MVVKIPPEISEEDLKGMPKVRNGHTRKFIQRSIIARRENLHVIMAKGYSQAQAANILHCSVETVNKDVAFLRKYYKQELHNYISEKLPEMWQSCMTLLMSTINAVTKIAEDPATTTHDKLHAYALLNECTELRLDMLSEPTMIQEAVHIIDNTKQKLVEISPNSAREILHMAEEEEDEKEEQHQQNQQQLQEQQQQQQENIIDEDSGGEREDDEDEDEEDANSTTTTTTTNKVF